MHIHRLDDPTQPPHNPDAPWLPADPCRYCDACHLQGWEPAGTVSHRRAPCFTDDSPYRVSGYAYLVLPEGTVPEPALA